MLIYVANKPQKSGFTGMGGLENVFSKCNIKCAEICCDVPVGGWVHAAAGILGA